MPLNLFLSFDIESKRSHNYITCEHSPGAGGIYWIMEQLESRGLPGVFFVNIYEHDLYPDGWMQALLKEIDSRGHEVALHCHQNRALEFYQKNLPSYDVAGQTRILRYGVDFIRDAVGRAPVSFRAGAFGLNLDTFRALENTGLLVDSSLWLPAANNQIDERLSINKACRYGGVLEIPVTLVRRGEKRSRIDPNRIPDYRALKAAVEQLIEAGSRHAVMLAHSFSFVLMTRKQSAGIPGVPAFDPNSTQFPVGEDSNLKKIFSDFLDYVAANPARITPALMRDLTDNSSELSFDGPDYVPKVPDNRLQAWPRVEDYQGRRIARLRARGQLYRDKPRRLIIHAGTWKTGSKALQKFWAANGSLLRSLGIAYPLNHRASYIQDANRTYQSRIFAQPGPDGISPIEVFAREIGADRSEICLLSHESIANQSRERLLELTSKFAGWSQKVVLYLRRQDDYAQSLYNQHVKGNIRFTGSFEDHFEQFRDRYDYRALVERMASVFGSENLVVRPYEKARFHGGAIHTDFMFHAFAMEVDDRFSLPPRGTNGRLSIETLELKRIINGLGGSVKLTRKFGKSLVRYATSLDANNRRAFQTHSLISPQRRREIVETFAEGNAWVARTFGISKDGRLFEAPLPDPSEAWSPVPILSLERASEIRDQLYLELRNTRKGSRLAEKFEVEFPELVTDRSAG